MPNVDYFHQRAEVNPMIYAYSDVQYPGCLKVGYSGVDVDRRVAQQYPTVRPDGKKPYRIVMRESAMYRDGGCFMDPAVHDELRRRKVRQLKGEWFRCDVEQVRAAVVAVQNRTHNDENRTETFGMRPEQARAVEMTRAFFQKWDAECSDQTHKFLWNAKMRFGKTFAAYQLAKQMRFQRVLILTFKPAVQSAWRDDLLHHVDFEGWQFISEGTDTGHIDEQYHHADKRRPIVCFGSFQDFMGVSKSGGIKAKNEWVHEINWDLVIFDEYHFGAWREEAKALFEEENDEEFENDYDEKRMNKYDRDLAYDEKMLPITANHYLYLSGTPFRALNTGEFLEDQIFSWTYSDEQKCKAEWRGTNNPYAALPQMILMTYRLPQEIQKIAEGGEFNEFDLNVFFKAEGEGENARFMHEEYVQKWLDLIRGDYKEHSIDELKMGATKPALPFSDIRLLSILNHTLWFMPDVASCFAMRNLMRKKNNKFYHDYAINVCAGTGAGNGAAALPPVLDSMNCDLHDCTKEMNPLCTKTITLSCGKLTTGVTVRPWTGILMLRNCKSPETYFQAAFRVQSPWTVKKDDGTDEILKNLCYIFDFALNRALRQVSEYSCQLNTGNLNHERKIEAFIRFLPVLAYDGSGMTTVDAAQILDLASNGVSGAMLAKRWQSALLVNVDNFTLSKILANPTALEALMKIEGFRSLNKDIELIINKTRDVKKAKKTAEDERTPKAKKEITAEEKEIKSKRKEIQEKLIKFATRIPIFMYLSEYREETLKDVITQLEPMLFQRVTGLMVKDFDLLCSMGVFNDSLMNEAVFQFWRYENASLQYAGVNRHAHESHIGGFSTILTRNEYEKLDHLLGISMNEKAFTPAINHREIETPIQIQSQTSSNVPKKQFKQHTHSSETNHVSGTSQTSLSNEKLKHAPLHETDAPFVGQTLVHQVLGKGVVTKIQGEKVSLVFGKIEKTFIYKIALSKGILRC